MKGESVTLTYYDEELTDVDAASWRRLADALWDAMGERERRRLGDEKNGKAATDERGVEGHR